jgi:ribosomal protein L11 methyltransferase
MLEGLPPHRPTHVMRLATNPEAARRITDLLGELFDPAESAVASFEDQDGVSWLIEAYFSFTPDEESIKDMVRPLVGYAADRAVFSTLTAKDWVKSSLDGLKPVRAWRFLVHGAHDRGFARINDYALEIDAALAFGTGHHGTTKGCLLALSRELKRRRPRHVLDVGTGTGILAFAAAKALKSTVIAGDIDGEAVEVAKGNARFNGLHPFMKLYTGPGIRHQWAAHPRHFDLIFANILARPLMRLAPTLKGVLAHEGRLILSGLLERDVPGIVSTYAMQGLRLEHKSLLEGWATLVLKRGPRTQ